MKPLTVALMAADVVGALLVPTLAARRLNEGTAAMSFHTMTMTALQMLAVSLVSGCCAIGAGYCCSVLAARVAKDMRDAIYVKSLDLSVFDFRRFGTASMVTRTMSDVVNIQVAITDVIMMMLPVPFIFVVALTFAFSLDTVLDNEANNLSVGQRQLLTIARVFLADPACSFSMRRQARWTPARSRRLQRRWTR